MVWSTLWLTDISICLPRRRYALPALTMSYLLCLVEIITDDDAVSWKLTADDLKAAADKACKASLKELKTIFPDVGPAGHCPAYACS